MAKQYSSLDNAALGPSLETGLGGLTLTTTADSLNLNRNARSRIGIAATAPDIYFEGVFYGSAALTMSNAAVGIVQSGVATNVWPGNVANSIGYRPADGAVYVNGSSVATVAPTLAKGVIGFALSQSAHTLKIYVNNLLVYTVTGLASAVWFPAISVGSTVARDLTGYLNLGLRPSENAPPTGYRFGVWSIVATTPIDPLASDFFLSSPTSPVPNASYKGRVMLPENLSIEQSASFWTDGSHGSSSQNTIGLDLENADGALDNYPDIITGTPFPIAIADLNSTAEPTLIATLVAKAAKPTKFDVMHVDLADAARKWDVPLPRRLVPPWMDAGAANQPFPIALGAVREAEPLLIDGINRVRVVHDDQLTNIAILRDKGDPLDPTATPPDYTATGDLRGVITNTDPAGTVTGDFSSQGTSSLTPTTGTDLLAGIGAMSTANSNGLPAGWEQTPAIGGYGTPSQVATDGGRARITFDTFTGGPQTQASYISTAIGAATILSGKRYRIKFDVKAADVSAEGINAAFGLIVNDTTGPRVDSVLGHSVLVGSLSDPAFGAGSFTVDFVAPFDVRYLCVGASLSILSGDPTPGSSWVEFDNVTVVKLPDPPVSGAPLQGISLTNFFKEIILRSERAGLTDADVDYTSTDAIDTSAPYPFGVYVQSAITIDGLSRAPLDSFCASITEDETGARRVIRLTDPELAADGDIVAEFDGSNLDDMPTWDRDPAIGLTARAGAPHNWYQFTDGTQFVDDFDPATGIDAQTRAQFMRASQNFVSTDVVLDPSYQFALDADPIPYLLDLLADAKAELNRVCGMFTKVRKHYTFSGALDDQSIPRVGDIVRVTWPRGDLAAGKKLFVKRVRYFPWSRRADITAWG